MASRMDRYYKEELVNSARSSKNKSLYRQIENLENYSNIEGVATIEKTNEIDISKVKEMLKNREDYKKQKRVKGLIAEEKKEENQIEIIEESPKNYDIKELLSNLEKSTSKENSKYRKLDEAQYNTLKNLNSKNKRYDIEKEEEELKELIQTMTSMKAIKSKENNDDVGLLDELKSDTIVGNATSINKIIKEEKKLKEFEDTTEMDKSFYTSSLGFTSKDFEDLKNINHNIKKSNKFIIILLIVIIVMFVVGVILLFILK